MNKNIALALIVALSLGLAACKDEKTTTESTETSTINGTTVETETSTETTVHDDGSTSREVESTTTVDPEGMMNKETTEEIKTEQHSE